jgi:hypothetical protein
MDMVARDLRVRRDGRFLASRLVENEDSNSFWQVLLEKFCGPKLLGRY